MLTINPTRIYFLTELLFLDHRVLILKSFDKTAKCIAVADDRFLAICNLIFIVNFKMTVIKLKKNTISKKNQMQICEKIFVDCISLFIFFSLSRQSTVMLFNCPYHLDVFPVVILE